MTDTVFSELETRLRIVEDAALIKDLQYAYWRHVDLNEPAQVRATLVDVGIAVNFPGEATIQDPDKLVQVVTGAPAAWQGSHLGSAPQINISGANEASAYWRVQMIGYQFEQRIKVNMTGEYHCEYLRTAHGWRIKAMKVTQTSLFIENIGDDGAVKAIRFEPVA